MRRRTWANQAPPQTFLNSLQAADAIATPDSQKAVEYANFGARTIQLTNDLIEQDKVNSADSASKSMVRLVRAEKMF